MNATVGATFAIDTVWFASLEAARAVRDLHGDGGRSRAVGEGAAEAAARDRRRALERAVRAAVG